MDFFKDFITTIKEQSVERVTSIFTGAFIFSWLAVNWKVLFFVIFSKQEIEVKLEQYPLYFPSDDLISFLLLEPLFISLAIVISIPFLNAFANFIKITVNFLLGKFQGKFSGWVSPKEAKKLVERIGELESEHASLFLKKDEEIERLTERYKNLEGKISEMQLAHVKQQEQMRVEVNKPLEAEKLLTRSAEVKFRESKGKLDSIETECKSLNEQLQSLQKQNNDLHQLQNSDIQKYPQYINIQANQKSQQVTISGLNKRLQDEKTNFERGLNELKNIVGNGATTREEQFKKIIEQYESNLSFATSLLEQAQKNNKTAVT